MRQFVVLGLALLVALAATPRTASASLLFPDVVKEYCHLPELPDCTLCHTVSPGIANTATKPFADMVRAYHAVEGDVATLEEALTAADQYDVDYDGDGVHDLDELRQGTDPNDGNDPPPPPPPPPTTETATTSSTTGDGGADGADSDDDSQNSLEATATTGPGRKPPPEQGLVPPDMRTGCNLASQAPTGAGLVGGIVMMLVIGRRRARGRRS